MKITRSPAIRGSERTAAGFGPPLSSREGATTINDLRYPYAYGWISQAAKSAAAALKHGRAPDLVAADLERALRDAEAHLKTKAMENVTKARENANG